MKSAKRILGLLLLSFLILGSFKAQSQTLLGSKMSEGFELFDPITNGTYLGNGDDPVFNITMPFTFKYDNQSVTTLYVYGNGFISFNTYREPSALAIPKLYVYPNIVSWYAGDLVTEDGFYYQVTGIAPFRVLTIEQRKARTFGNGGGSTFDVQIKFYESSNQIKIIYGNTAGLGASSIYGWIYFTGSVASNYINIQPNDPNYPSTFHYSNINPDQNRYILADAPFKIPKGKTYTLKVLPSITKVNPDGKYVLTKDYIYDDDINRPYVLISREASQQNVALRYKIYGPIGDPNAQTIYTAINNPSDTTNELVQLSPQPVGNAYRYNIANAKGIAAGANGALDLKTNQNLIKGGLYQVTAVLDMGNPSLNQTVTSTFYIALDYDLEATKINLPVTKDASPYKYGDHRVPLSLRVTNVGKYDINYFTVEADIYNALNNSLVATKTQVWQNLNTPLSRNDFVDVFLPDFNPPSIGDYYVVYTVSTDQYHPDTGLDNNQIPRAGSPNYIFAVNFETEIALTQVLAPSSSTFQYIPFRPGVRVVNNGAIDATNVPMTITITKNNIVKYTQTVTIPSIPSGIANTLDYYCDVPFTPTETGSYAVSFSAPVSGDEIPSNNNIAYAFTVTGGLSGDYTISANGSGTRNFPTIQDAVDALYKQGVCGPTTFKFLDQNYTIGYAGVTDKPAIDMTSKIPGMSSTNTVTFKASEEISQRGFVKIHIQSGSGIGFLFGQSVTPNNMYAPINNTSDASKKLYADNDGYITFDGGPLYTIQVIMESTNASVRVPFYLGNGASNITLNNLLITDNTPLFAGNIPLISFSAGALREFNYQADNNITAAIYLRSIAPYDVKTGGNTYDVDTLVNKNNVISGNVISGFGYGVVDLGIGVLKQPLSDNIITFYNKNNIIKKNTMTNIGFAGVYMGFESNTTIANNRIDNVQNNVRTAAGIYLGGKANKTNLGYHNINIKIDGNEISNIKAPINASGILVHQYGFNFGSGQNTQFFPETDDNISILNNIVRDINVVNTTTNQYGIILMPSRDYTLGDDHLSYRPKLNFYYVKGNKIANNTIILDDQNEEFIQNSGEIAGIGLAQVLNTEVVNNAIAIKDALIQSNNYLAAALFYYNPMPKEANVTFNNNVYWINQSTADFARFIETTMDMNIYEWGAPREFSRLDQWQAWTGEDMKSVSIYNFLNDLTVSATSPSKLRAKTNPVPVGSVLEGRGLTLDYNTIDIDGNIRGYAGHRYNVGAEQFTGKPYIVDVEMLNFSQPLVYQATTGFPFDDAQYIMTKAPVDITTQIRNNGTQMQSGIIATLNIYRESNNNRFEDGKLVMTTSVTVDKLNPGEIREISFNTADGVSPDFIPQAYASFNGTADAYTNIPTQFVNMNGNVTPRYKFVVSINYDENNANNSISETTRYFLQRSKLQMLISTENWQTLDTANLPSDPNIIAANLNLDSLTAGLFRLGWYRNLDLEDPRIDYDVFDRKAWERRSVDYNLYKTMFWVDGHDTYLNAGVPTTNTLSIYEYNQLIGFMNSGIPNVEKKNLFISSQDFVRNNESLFPTFDSYFHAGTASPVSPLNAPNNNFAGRTLNGIYIGRLQVFPVQETYLENTNSELYPNNYPIPGLFTMQAEGMGVPRVGMLYDTVSFDSRVWGSFSKVPDSLKIAAITTNAVPYNVCILGVDWRHWGDIEKTLRSIVDYANANDGNVVPIDLLSFEAVPSNNRVDLNWTTASEINSTRFDIERSLVINGLEQGFVKIGEEQARGNASSITHYGPFVDNQVQYGNTYSYRLKMIDKNGEFKYSDEKTVTLLGNDGVISVSEVQPNPVNSSSVVDIYLSNANDVNIALYDMAGSLVKVFATGQMNSGDNQITINAADFNSGAYNLIINIGNQTFTKKVNIVK